MTETNETNATKRNLYAELAELKLQNRMLSERLDMMTSTATHYIEMRADICRQLETFGLALAINNQIVERKKR